MTVDQLQVVISAQTKPIENAMKRVNNQLEKMSKRAEISNKKLQTSFDKSVGSISKTKLALIAAGIVAAKAGKAIFSLGSDAATVDNQMSALSKTMGNSSGQFMKWARDVASDFGISETAAVSFGNQISSILSRTEKDGKVVADLSQEYLKMGAIIAANTHFEVDDVMGRIRSGLSGRNEAIEDLGIEVKPGVIKGTEAYAAAVRKTGVAWEQMTDAQQGNVRIQAILEQGQKRYGTELGGLSGQLLVLKASLDNMKLAWGRAFAPIVELVIPVIQKLVGWLSIAATWVQVFFGMFTSFGGKNARSSVKDLNAGLQSVGASAGSASDSVDSIGNNLKDANKDAKKLQRTLFGFDVIHNVNEPQDSPVSGGGTVGGGGGGLDSGLLDDILNKTEDYENSLEKVRQKAQSVRNNLLDWLGFTYDINTETGKLFNLEWGGFKEMATSAKVVATILAGIAAVWVAIKAYGIVVFIAGLIAKVGAVIGAVSGAISVFALWVSELGFLKGILDLVMIAIGGISAPVWIAIAAITAIVAAVAAFKWGAKDAVKDVDILGGVSEATAEKLRPFKKNLDEVNETILSLSWGNKIITDEDVAQIEGKLTQIRDMIANELVAELEETKRLMEEENYFDWLDPAGKHDFIGNLEKGNKRTLEEIDANNEKIIKLMKEKAANGETITKEEAQAILGITDDMLSTGIRVMTANQEEQDTILRNIKDNAEQITAEQAKAVVKNANETKEKVIKEAQDRYAGEMRVLDDQLASNAISQERYDELAKQAEDNKLNTISEAEEMNKNILSEAKESYGEYGKYIDEETGEWKSKWQVLKEDVSTKAKEMKDSVVESAKELADKAGDKIQDFKDGVGKKFDDVKEFGAKINKYFKEDFKEDWSKAWDGVKNIFADKWNSMKALMRTPMNFIIKQINKVFEGFNKLKVPSWVPLIGGKGFNFKPIAEIPAYATGGFPEDGLFWANSNELVGQFSNGKTAVVNNAQIIDGVSSGVAKAISGVMGGQANGQPINLTVQIGANQIAKEVINAVDDYTMKTGMTFKTI